MMKALLHFLIRKIAYSDHKKRQTAGSVLVNVSSGIGDAVMAEPLIRSVRTSLPTGIIGVLCSPPTEVIFRRHPSINVVFVLPTGLWARLQLIWAIRKQGFDIYIGALPSNTIRHLLIPYFASIPRRIKHRSPHQGHQNYDFLFDPVVPLDKTKHRVLCNLDLLPPIGLEAVNSVPQLDVDKGTLAKVQKELSRAGWDASYSLVGFHIGCNPAAMEKRWPPERFAEVARHLYAKTQSCILLLGGPDEKEENRVFESRFDGIILNFAGKLNLLETAAAITFCSFFISNDSGLMHLATAVNRPAFAIFGPKDERHIGPFGNRHTVIRKGSRVDDVQTNDVIKVLEDSEFGIPSLQRSNIRE